MSPSPLGSSIEAPGPSPWYVKGKILETPSGSFRRVAVGSGSTAGATALTNPAGQPVLLLDSNAMCKAYRPKKSWCGTSDWQIPHSPAHRGESYSRFWTFQNCCRSIAESRPFGDLGTTERASFLNRTSRRYLSLAVTRNLAPIRWRLPRISHRSGKYSFSPTMAERFPTQTYVVLSSFLSFRKDSSPFSRKTGSIAGRTISVINGLRAFGAIQSVPGSFEKASGSEFSCSMRAAVRSRNGWFKMPSTVQEDSLH